MTDVILKGEFHNSSADQRQERDILTEGVSALVLEGKDPESEQTFAVHESWLFWVFALFDWIMSPIYQSSDLLIDLARSQDAEIKYTRETDYSLSRNAPWYVHLTAALTFYFVFLISMAVGIYWNQTIFGATLLFLSILIPLLTLRIYNMRVNEGEKNRDRIMANKIENAVNYEDEPVLAIVGDSHVEGVRGHISDEIDVEVKEPAQSRLSVPFLREYAEGIIKAYSLTLGLYLMILFAMERLIQYAP